jgi:hypothetical protein
MAVPRRSDDLGDDPELHRRASRIMLRHGQAILDSVVELTDLGIGYANRPGKLERFT